MATIKEGWLVLGTKGPLVKILQQTLNEAKLACVVAEDGKFGKDTLAAVKEFQKENSLKVDGIVGPKTAAKLKNKKLIAGINKNVEAAEEAAEEAEAKESKESEKEE